jgi:hypothetical protein
VVEIEEVHPKAAGRSSRTARAAGAFRFAPANDNRAPPRVWARWLAIVAVTAVLVACLVQYVKF